MWDFPLVHFNGCQCYCGSTSSSTWLWIVVGTRLMTHSSICKRHTHERGRGREGGRERRREGGKEGGREGGEEGGREGGEEGGRERRDVHLLHIHYQPNH